MGEKINITMISLEIFTIWQNLYSNLRKNHTSIDEFDISDLAG